MPTSTKKGSGMLIMDDDSSIDDKNVSNDEQSTYSQDNDNATEDKEQEKASSNEQEGYAENEVQVRRW